MYVEDKRDISSPENRVAGKYTTIGQVALVFRER